MTETYHKQTVQQQSGQRNDKFIIVFKINHTTAKFIFKESLMYFLVYLLLHSRPLSALCIYLNFPLSVKRMKVKKN